MGKKGLFGKLIIVAVLLLLLVFGTSLYLSIDNGEVEIGAGNVVVNLDYNISHQNSTNTTVSQPNDKPQIVEVD